MSENKREALIYDVCSVPQGITMDKVVRIWKDFNLILYDSLNKGNAPVLMDAEKVKSKLVDISNTTPEILSQISKLLEDE